MKPNIHQNYNDGFTVTEILVTMLILAVIVIFAIPSYSNLINQRRLKMATEDLYNFIKASEARGLDLPSSYYLSFQPGNPWCYGLSDSSTCNCALANSCTVQGLQTIMSSTNYSGELLSLSTSGFNGASSNPYITFKGNQGSIDTAGTITLSTASGLSTIISANQQGLITICSNTVSSYPSC